MSERDLLNEIANRYREAKGNVRPEDFLLENQWLLLHTKPPVLVQPKEWIGDAYKSKLRGQMADGKILVFDPQMIDIRIIKRFVTKKDMRALLPYILPE